MHRPRAFLSSLAGLFGIGKATSRVFEPQQSSFGFQTTKRYRWKKLRASGYVPMRRSRRSLKSQR